MTTHHSTLKREFRVLVENEAGGRVCSRCRVWRDREEYAPSAWERRSGFYGCRACRVPHQRRAALKARYGLTEEAFEALLEQQGGVCALCRRLPEPSSVGRPALVVDHDHATGRVRGLLCDSCNSALGKLGDDEAGLRRALEYVSSRR